MRNIQWPADGHAKAVLVVAGLVLRLPVQRVWFRIKNRATVAVKDGAVRLVYVETAHAAPAASTSHHNDHGPGAAPAKASAAESAKTASARHLNVGCGAAQRNRPAASTLVRQLLPQ